MREARLTFGGRLLCPFLRPFFLDPADEARVKGAAETLWVLGERVARIASTDAVMLQRLGLSEAEVRLALIDPGYEVASTAARADAFILPDSLQFAEYNAESPAGPGYSQGLAELFAAVTRDDPALAGFRDRFDVRFYTPIARLLEALLASYKDWGGTASPPRMAIVDWREVPTWSEFELLRDAFVAAGVPTVVCDPRDLVFEGGALSAGGERIDFVYRRVLINDIVARPDECRALIEAYRAKAVCVANTLRCKIAHKKAFFAVLTDDRFASHFSDAERAIVAAHVPWTRVVDETRADDIRRRREPFPVCEAAGVAERNMLVDFAPYVFRGRVAGFLTRLSATGLANVTSGGGQVPAFVVQPRNA